MWSALKERPGYENENWLIIVTSNYGGDVQMVEGKEFADHYADVSRNTFTLMYNERLVSQIQAAPGNTALSYSFSTPAWSYDYRNPNPNRYAESARLGNTEMGEFYFNDKNEIEPVTIQFFLSSSVYNSRKYVILSKSSNMDEKTKVGNGWFFILMRIPIIDVFVSDLVEKDGSYKLKMRTIWTGVNGMFLL